MRQPIGLRFVVKRGSLNSTLGDFSIFYVLVVFLVFGFMMAACGVASIVFGIIGIRKPGKIKFLKSKPLSIIMIIAGVIVIIIALAAAVSGVYLGYLSVSLVRGLR